jgi:hypothetical protein
MAKVPKRPGTKRFPSEVVTLARLFALKGVSTRAFSRWLPRNSGVLGARKTRVGAQPPDRPAPFAPIAAQVSDFQHRGEPIIAVDAQKTEWVGDCKNAGREGHRPGQGPQGRIYDWVDPAWGKARP